MINIDREIKVFLYEGSIDMRSGFERLGFFCAKSVASKIGAWKSLCFSGQESSAGEVSLS